MHVRNPALSPRACHLKEIVISKSLSPQENSSFRSEVRDPGFARHHAAPTRGSACTTVEERRLQRRVKCHNECWASAPEETLPTTVFSTAHPCDVQPGLAKQIARKLVHALAAQLLAL